MCKELGIYTETNLCSQWRQIKGNYDLQLAGRFSNYLLIAIYILRPKQISSNAPESPACFGLRTKNRPR